MLKADEIQFVKNGLADKERKIIARQNLTIVLLIINIVMLFLSVDTDTLLYRFITLIIK